MTKEKRQRRSEDASEETREEHRLEESGYPL